LWAAEEKKVMKLSQDANPKIILQGKQSADNRTGADNWITHNSNNKITGKSLVLEQLLLIQPNTVL